MRPTHVMVGVPIDCKCSNKGAPIEPEEPGVCPCCGGATLRTRLITLEEFARLFTWGKTFLTDHKHRVEGERNDIRVVPDDDYPDYGTGGGGQW